MGKQTALLGKLFHDAKTGYCCEVFHPMGGIEKGESTEELKFELEFMGRLSLLSAAGDGFSACNYCNVRMASGYHLYESHIHQHRFALKKVIHLLIH